MTEAATALVAAHFARSDATLISGHIPGNAASARVLGKLGFRNTQRIVRHSNPMGREVEVQRMELTSAAWKARPRGN